MDRKLKKLREELKKDSNGSDSSELKKELETMKSKLDAAIDAQTALSKEKEVISTERNQVKDELSRIEEERKTILDENVSLNSELHKLNAERLFDLKSELKKPDVAGIKTIEDRGKKVDEFAQRSIDSIKDQINDLLIEKNSDPNALKSLAQVNNPGIVHEDSGETSKKGKKKSESKGDTLKRLFNNGNKQ
jgi:predicted nuclease with TOPRIM domain